MKNIYSKDIEEKKTWYSSVAHAYNKTRPGYSKKLIQRILSLAQLPQNAKVLEIGCGPGTATTTFASFGLSMVCLEPCLESCQLARENCQPYPNVEIINTTFEEWPLEKNKFAAVIAATSFHWVSPETVYKKAVQALEENGSLILLWNTPPQPNVKVCQSLNQLYQTYAPSVTPHQDIPTHQENLSKLGQKIIDSGYFHELVSEQSICSATYSIDDYLTFLTTLSPYIMLEQHQRDALLGAIGETLKENCGNTMETSYLSVFQIMGKRQEARDKKG